MIVIGLTGGIGSGKTTVSAGLVARGARLIDADAIVRELQHPGGEMLAAMTERFGDGILAADGALDRVAMAAVVFGETDDQSVRSARSDLNAIVHPPVGREIRTRLLDAQVASESLASGHQVSGHQVSGHLVVLDIPLLAEGLLSGNPPLYAVSGVLVVDTPTKLAVERVVTGRSMPRTDVEARVSSQVTRCQRLSVADHVLVNTGSLAELEPRIDAAHAWAMSLEPTPPPQGFE